jgi:hypothetical protein
MSPFGVIEALSMLLTTAFSPSRAQLSSGQANARAISSALSWISLRDPVAVTSATRGYSEKATAAGKRRFIQCVSSQIARRITALTNLSSDKLATSLSGLTNYLADCPCILCRTAIKQRRPNNAKREPPTNVPAGLVKHHGAPAMAPTASVASPFYKQFPDSASERSTVTGRAR